MEIHLSTEFSIVAYKAENGCCVSEVGKRDDLEELETLGPVPTSPQALL